MARLRLIKRATAWMARHIGWLSNVVISLVLAGLGWFLVQWRELLWPTHGDERIEWQDMGMDPLQRLSYDVPFVTRQSIPTWLRSAATSPRETKDVVILYMDEDSARQLAQPPGGPWQRSMHARLVDWLTKDGARAVVFDLVFDTASADDPVFAEALRRNGKAFIGATINTNTAAPLTPDEAQRFQQVGIATEQLIKPNATLSKAARGWGLLTFRPIDADYGARRLFVGKPREGLDPWPAISWRVAQALGANLPEDDQRFERRWINYFGPAGCIESISYHRALLEAGGVPPGYFKDRIVLVGARSELGMSSRKSQDVFSTPWSRFSARNFTPGAEIHATSLLNLLRHDWLSRVPLHVEKVLVVLIGLSAGALRWLRPWRVVWASLVAWLVIFAVSCFAQWEWRVWWNWAVPLCIQLPLATLLAVGSRYYLEERRKRKLRAAFGLYLSPDLAAEIAERDFPLAPGGGKVLATMIFTDLEGFTTLAERIGDSSRVANELIQYFTRATDEIFAENGTVIKFIGDSVFAAWGAPLPQADQAERAARAACRLSQISNLEIEVPESDGRMTTLRLRTRIGVHTGEALAGNLGSAKRFDYTLIGDEVNFASRLESLNKHVGTSILLSHATADRLGGKFLLRRLGAMRVKGKKKAVVIYELLGNDPADRPAWLATFDEAVAQWERGELAQAGASFARVIEERGGKDGPSEFYLRQIDRVVSTADWTGEVTLDEK